MFFAYLGMTMVARFLGPTDFGLISLASAVATVASTVVLVGMPEGVVKYISFYKGRNNEGSSEIAIVSNFLKATLSSSPSSIIHNKCFCFYLLR